MWKVRRPEPYVSLVEFAHVWEITSWTLCVSERVRGGVGLREADGCQRRRRSLAGHCGRRVAVGGGGGGRVIGWLLEDEDMAVARRVGCRLLVC